MKDPLTAEGQEDATETKGTSHVTVSQDDKAASSGEGRKTRVHTETYGGVSTSLLQAEA